jgi:hypothetical protein
MKDRKKDRGHYEKWYSRSTGKARLKKKGVKVKRLEEFGAMGGGEEGHH